MHSLESVLENETHKLFWDLEIQTDHLISARRTDLIIINKKKKKKKKRKRICRIVDFAVLADHRVKLRESEKNDKYLDFARELKKNVEHESDGYTNYNYCSWYRDGKTWEIRERVETIQTTALLRSARILRRVLET